MAAQMDNVRQGGSEGVEASNFFNTAPAADSACFKDAYSGLDKGSDAKGGSLGFLDGMERAMDSIPNQVDGARSEMIGGDGSQPRAWETAKVADGKMDIPPADDLYRGDSRKHAGMAALAAGAMDGRAGGDVLGLNPDRIRREAQQLADGIVLQKAHS